MKKMIAMLLTAAMVMGLCVTGCGGKNDTKETSYAVEAGSAAEEVAKEKGYKYNSVSSQADALMEVASGTSNAAIIDLLMAGAMIGEGTSYPNLTYTEELTEEEYGIGCRKDSDLASYINAVLAESYADGTMQKIADKYGVREELLIKQEKSEYVASEKDSDVEHIKEKGKLIIGITEFAPMDYKDDDGNWIGFDADMARLVAEKLGVEAVFTVIVDWDSKVMELETGNVDVVWNGMTLTNAVLSSMECTNAYCKNAQVVVVPQK